MNPKECWYVRGAAGTDSASHCGVPLMAEILRCRMNCDIQGHVKELWGVHPSRLGTRTIR
jgi:hypothetical protein